MSVFVNAIFVHRFSFSISILFSFIFFSRITYNKIIFLIITNWIIIDLIYIFFYCLTLLLFLYGLMMFEILYRVNLFSLRPIKFKADLRHFFSRQIRTNKRILFFVSINKNSITLSLI